MTQAIEAHSGGESPLLDDCGCVRLLPDEIPGDAIRMPTDLAWHWTCRHGHQFIRWDPRWDRTYTLEEFRAGITITSSFTSSLPGGHW